MQDQRIAAAAGSKAELAIRSLYHFVRYMWKVVEPADFDDNWHIPLLCEELEAVSRGETKELVLCVPPGSLKSLLVCVFYPAWHWLLHPESRSLYITNDEALTSRDSRRTRQLIVSDQYQDLLLHVHKSRDLPLWSFSDDQNAVLDFANTEQGFRVGRSIGAAITGKRGDNLIIDDPVDVKMVLDEPQRVAERMEGVWETYKDRLKSRLNNPAEYSVIVIMQRLHMDDLAGKLIRQKLDEPEEYADRKIVSIAMEYDPTHPFVHPKDPRKRKGELFFPRRWSEQWARKTKKEMSPAMWAAQYQQMPIPSDGALFREDMFREYAFDPARPPDEWDKVLCSVDAAFKGTEKSDFVVMQVWGFLGTDAYLLDIVRARLDYPSTKAALRVLAAKWPTILEFVIEEKANGAALIAEMSRELPRVVPVTPRDSKFARIQTSAVYFHARRVYFPTKEHLPGIVEHKRECLAYPAVRNDDQIDCQAQILNYCFTPVPGDAPAAHVQLGFLMQNTSPEFTQAPQLTTGDLLRNLQAVMGGRLLTGLTSN